MQIEIPGYRIIRTLGKGGMASVYLAIQESFEREVALKVMSPELSKDAAFGERFLREARIVSRLIHPNIVTVYDVGIHEGYYFLSMEYVPGQDLTRKRFDLSLSDGLNVIKDIARALDFAGKKGYVHRDVKPENIMLQDDSGRAVLMDFGIARTADLVSSMTQTGMAIGTPHYMSPEQAKGQAVDARADIYSLGVVLFLLLTGRVPYHADSAVVVGVMHVSEDIPRLPPHLEIFQPIIDRVLAKEPLQRYQTGAELIEALDAVSAFDIAEAAAQREQEQCSVKNNAVVFADETTSAISYSQAASFFSAGAASPTLPTTKVPALVLPDSENSASVDPMVASAEDRVGRSGSANEGEQKVGQGGRLLVLTLFLLSAIGFYFQTEIKTWLQLYLSTTSEAINTPLDAPAEISPDVDANLSQPELDISPGLIEPLLENTETVITEPAQDLPPVAAPSTGLDDVLTQAVPSENTPAPSVSEEVEQQKAAEDLLALAQAQTLAAEQSLLDKAKSQVAVGQLIAPSGDNALETYRELLSRNPGQVSAREGEAAIEKALVQDVEQLIRSESFLVAGTRLASAREQFPHSQVLLSLSLNLEQAMLDKLPRVARLAVTSTEMSTVEPQETTIAADRTIYIGFEYRNFKADASVIQAILFDGSRSHQIVQVPVIVSGATGTQFFRMEQPVAGFAEGGYSIDLLLDEQLLITARFSVKKP